jgi:membrane protein
VRPRRSITAVARTATIALVGLPRVAMARRVIARYSSVDGGLLAAGLAYNAALALIPVGLLAAALAGLFLADPASQARLVTAVVTIAPPLAGVIDDIVRGLAAASTSLSVVGLILAGWGSSRLYASLESGIAQMFVGSPRRGFVSRTVRRVGAVAVLAFIVTAALIAVPALSVAAEILREAGPLEGALVTVGLVIATLAVTMIALTSLYRVLPAVTPTWAEIRRPAAVAALALLLVTRAFTLVAGRLFGANVVYGTLGALFVGLAWLDVVFTVVLVAAAWVRERATDEEAAVA